MDINAEIAKEFGLKKEQVDNTVALIDDDKTIPFIARYRKEVTGSLDDQVLRELSDRLNYLRNLEKRKEEVRASITEQEKMTDELEKAITDAMTLVEVEDIYRPYKPKRKTRASVAREKGLEDLAAFVLNQGEGDPSAEAEKYINECIEKDKRIHFYGFLPSRNDVLKLQQQASLLINMRLPSEPVSAYSFPSKLFEYMATGIPVISFKLEGIPKEYYKYLVMVNDESVESLRDTIENAFANISNLTIMAQKGAHFITEEKNMYCQSERIISFLESITK